MVVSIVDLQINPRIVSATKRAGLHDSTTVLHLSSADLVRLTGLTTGDIKQLKDAVSEAVLGNQAVAFTALQLWRHERSEDNRVPRLSLGCKQLDKVMRGGLLLHSITEVVGESASGKTQLCLQLSLTAQLPVSHGGLNGGVVYICTEDAFPNRRLDQMAKHFTNKYAGVVQHRFTDSIFLEHVADLDGLEQCLYKKLPLALVHRQIKLVVIDSVAALFRCHYDSHQLVSRAKHLASLACQLRRLAEQHNMVVVCVNQVSANMSRVSDTFSQPRQSIPALGLVWADHVTCRLLTSRCDSEVTVFTPEQGAGRATEEKSDADSVGADWGKVSRKLLEVVFAPHLAPVVVPLVVSHSGIAVDISETFR